MNSIDVIVEGYAYENEDGSWNASSTTTLIQSKGKKVLVDPGANKEKLLSALNEMSLQINDIDILFLTHYHPDHLLNIRLFPDSAVYDGETIYTDDLEEFFEDKIPGSEIEVFETPGHAHEEVSLKVVVGGEVYVVAQDVFWWIDGKQKSNRVEDLMNLEDPFASDVKALKSSRKKVLEVADWIIPGHGKPFKNPAKQTK